MTDNVRGLDAARVNHGFIAAIVVVATIGGFMFGYDSGVINGTQKGLEAAFDLGGASPAYCSLLDHSQLAACYLLLTHCRPPSTMASHQRRSRSPSVTLVLS